MPVMKNGNVGIAWESHGEGYPILLSHGYASTQQMWQGQIELLAQRYRLITWDMRGHGLSDSPDDPAEYSEAKTVQDMALLLDAADVRQAVIGGLSLGGYMSLGFYHAHPDRVRALMLFDTGPGYRKDEARAEWNVMADRRASAFEEQGLAAVGRSAEVLVATHRSAAGLAKAARGMLAQFDDHVMRLLPDIAVPTLVLVGSEDKPFHGGSQYMAAKIPGAEYVVVPDAGHSANIDQPQAFNAAVLSFLDKLGL